MITVTSKARYENGLSRSPIEAAEALLELFLQKVTADNSSPVSLRLQTETFSARSGFLGCMYSEQVSICILKSVITLIPAPGLARSHQRTQNTATGMRAV
jgi:hypothetical protein